MVNQCLPTLLERILWKYAVASNFSKRLESIVNMISRFIDIASISYYRVKSLKIVILFPNYLEPYSTVSIAFHHESMQNLVILHKTWNEQTHLASQWSSFAWILSIVIRFRYRFSSFRTYSMVICSSEENEILKRSVHRVFLLADIEKISDQFPEFYQLYA